MNNFIPYDYNSIVPSDLSSKTIIMIGRGSDRQKRLDLGIEAMQYIIKDIPKCKMIVISKLDKNNYLQNLTQKLNLNKKINFVGFCSQPEKYFRNVSLHIFPSIAEAFPNVLCETLIYGIPNILIGIDYVSIAKGGTIILYDDSALSIAKIAIKILLNKSLRKKLGKQARENMKKYSNDRLLNKWTSLILSIHKGDNFYEQLRNNDTKITQKEALKIISNQIYLLKKRKKRFENITVSDIENFTYMYKIQ
jgi:glycosyltransferase involved in cell wall biosynthesis